MRRRFRTLKLFLIAAVAVAASALALSRVSAGTEPPEPAAIRLTPPAPVFDDAMRLDELAARRKQVAGSIGPKAMLVLFSADPRVYTNDVDFPYRQENNLFYLTHLNQKRATLILMPGNTVTPEILFLPRRSAAAETWTGHMYSPEEAAEFEPFIQAVRTHQPFQPQPRNVLVTNRSNGSPSSSGLEAINAAAARNEASLYLLANFPREGESREFRQEQRFDGTWAKETGFNVQSAWPIFSQMRLRKSAMELELIQHAIDISIEAHERAEAFAAQARWEYEVDAQVAYTFKLRNADNWGYPDIVGCGPNTTTLHYEESQGPVKSGQLMLMDDGAEYEHYSADVTRTFPVNGKFTKEQAEIYQIVFDAQEAAAKVAGDWKHPRRLNEPAAGLQEMNRAASDVIRDGLLRLGLIVDRNSEQYRIWFMHSTGHWLGMNVHDVGGGPFTPGMVFTNEPGIYIRPDALDNLPKTPENERFIAAIRPAFEKYKGIGVRIEDDMRITDSGVKWMTAALPRSIADVEAFIARARREGSPR